MDYGCIYACICLYHVLQTVSRRTLDFNDESYYGEDSYIGTQIMAREPCDNCNMQKACSCRVIRCPRGHLLCKDGGGNSAGCTLTTCGVEHCPNKHNIWGTLQVNRYGCSPTECRLKQFKRNVRVFSHGKKEMPQNVWKWLHPDNDGNDKYAHPFSILH